MSYEYSKIITLTDAEVTAKPILAGFYDMIAEKLGLYHPENRDGDHQYVFDCRHINVAKNIQDACFKHFVEQGVPEYQVAMHLCLSGPKVDPDLPENCVGIEDGYIKRALTVDVKCKQCGREFRVTYCEDGSSEASDEQCYCDDYAVIGKYPAKDEWLRVLKLRGKSAVIHVRRNHRLAERNGQSCKVIDTTPDGNGQMRKDGLSIMVEFEDGTKESVRECDIIIA